MLDLDKAKYATFRTPALHTVTRTADTNPSHGSQHPAEAVHGAALRRDLHDEAREGVHFVVTELLPSKLMSCGLRGSSDR